MADPEAHAGRIKIKGSVGLRAIVKRILLLGSTVTEADVSATLISAIIAIESYLQEGYRINFGDLMSVYPSIEGQFIDPEDRYDPSRHSLGVNTIASKRLLKLMAQCVPNYVDNADVAPVVTKYADPESDTVNTSITLSGIGRITGKRLDYDATQADEGLFYVDSVDNTESHKITVFLEKTVTKLSFKTPTLATTNGEGYLELRKRHKSRGNDLLTSKTPENLTAV